MTNDNVVPLRTNPSGIRPSEFKVLVKPLKIEEKTQGGIILPDANKEREQYAQMQGRVIAISPLAFTYADLAEWKGEKPKTGQLVVFAKYSGLNVAGNDGVEYTIINDKDICAVIEEK